MSQKVRTLAVCLVLWLAALGNAQTSDPVIKYYVINTIPPLGLLSPSKPTPYVMVVAENIPPEEQASYTFKLTYTLPDGSKHVDAQTMPRGGNPAYLTALFLTDGVATVTDVTLTIKTAPGARIHRGVSGVVK